MNNQQAIDRLAKHLEYGWSEPTVEAIDMGIHALKESRWIPCSERLPESEEYVLASFENESLKPNTATYTTDSEGNGMFCLAGFPCAKLGIFVNAWMPLPERYREEGDEK